MGRTAALVRISATALVLLVGVALLRELASGNEVRRKAAVYADCAIRARQVIAHPGLLPDGDAAVSVVDSGGHAIVERMAPIGSGRTVAAGGACEIGSSCRGAERAAQRAIYPQGHDVNPLDTSNVNPDADLRERGVIRGKAFLPPDLRSLRTDLALYAVVRDSYSVRRLVIPGAIREDGTYELKGLSQGAYSLQLGFRSSPRSEVVRVTLSASAPDAVADFRFAQARGLKLAGWIVSAEDQQPIRDVSVSIKYEFGVRTDARGMFVLEGVPNEPFALWVQHPDYRGKTITVDPVRTSQIQVVLERGARAILSAVDGAGAPVERVHIRILEGSARKPWPPRITDRAGTATFTGLTPGETYMVDVVGQGRLVGAPREFSAAVGETKNLQVVVGRD